MMKVKTFQGFRFCGIYYKASAKSHEIDDAAAEWAVERGLAARYVASARKKATKNKGKAPENK